MAGNETNNNEALSDKARDAGEKASAAAKDFGRQVSDAASDYKAQSKSAANDLGDATSGKLDGLKDQVGSVADQLKAQAGQHVGEAKDIVSNIAAEARSKVAEMVDQQKNAGADRLSGFSRAAQSAAGELEDKNPQVARLMRDAASTVDGFAGDLRSSDLGDVVASISDFARKQPVAFFAVSVVAGFVLARFVKSSPAEAQPFPRRVSNR